MRVTPQGLRGMAGQGVHAAYGFEHSGISFFAQKPGSWNPVAGTILMVDPNDKTLPHHEQRYPVHGCTKGIRP